MKSFQVPAILASYRSTADKGLSLTFRTQELSAEEQVKVAGFHQGFGYLLFKENEFKDVDVPKEDAPEFGRTSSERLRNVLYRVWQQLTKENRANGDFEAWRSAEMERLIEHYKQKLPQQ
jgi:hypothetical protein